MLLLIHTDLLEGLKRAQRFRLEDQRGTEINFELPDFLKDNEINARNKFRKTKAGSSASDEPTEPAIPSTRGAVHESPIKPAPPQPAPRFLNKPPNHLPSHNIETASLGHDSRLNSSSSSTTSSSMNGSNSSAQNHYENGEYITCVGGLKTFGTPPPLPPKPKIKPSNWSSISGNAVNPSPSAVLHAKDGLPFGSELSPRRIAQTSAMGNDSKAAKNVSIPSPRSIYLDQPNSSFVWAWALDIFGCMCNLSRRQYRKLDIVWHFGYGRHDHQIATAQNYFIVRFMTWIFFLVIVHTIIIYMYRYLKLLAFKQTNLLWKYDN